MNRFIVLLCIILCILSCKTVDIDYSKKPVLVKSSEISVDYKIKSDLSISLEWKLSQKLKFLKTKNMFIEFEVITMDNERIGMFLAMFDHFSTGIRPEDIIKPLVIAYPKSPKYLHGIITKYNDTWTEEEQWFFNIDISNINVIISGEEMKPGIFKRFAGQWVPETITLEDGQWFITNAYYLITSHGPRHGEPEINETLYPIFKVGRDTEIIHNEDSKLNLNSGGLRLNELHLRQILINSNNGLTLIVTPESKNIFKVEEGAVHRY